MSDSIIFLAVGALLVAVAMLRRARLGSWGLVVPKVARVEQPMPRPAAHLTRSAILARLAFYVSTWIVSRLVVDSDLSARVAITLSSIYTAGFAWYVLFEYRQWRRRSASNYVAK